MSNDPLIARDNEPDELQSYLQWAEHHGDKAESTVKRYRSALRQWVTYCRREAVDLTEPTTDEVEDFLAGMKADGYAEKTVSGTRAALSSFIRREGNYDGDTPVDRADLGTWTAESEKSKADRREELHWFREDEIERLLDPENIPAPTTRNRLLIRLMLQTGVRASEIQTIQVGRDPDWESNELGDIDRKRREITIIDHKNDDTRPVFYQPSLDQALRIWISVERDGVYRADQSEYLFPTKNSDSIDPQRINEIVKGAAENAGLQDTYYTSADGREWSQSTAHVLRHTCAMHAVRNDVDTHWLQQTLGHSDISTTVDRYLHQDHEALREAWQDRGPSF
jgi:integrase/recombinase XerD